MRSLNCSPEGTPATGLIVDLFAGPGGWSEGLRMLQLKVETTGSTLVACPECGDEVLVVNGVLAPHHLILPGEPWRACLGGGSPAKCQRHGRPVTLVRAFLNAGRGSMVPTDDFHCAVCGDRTRGPEWRFDGVA